MALTEKYSKECIQSEGFVDELDRSHMERLELLRQVFWKAAAADTPTEVGTDGYFYFVFLSPNFLVYQTHR